MKGNVGSSLRLFMHLLKMWNVDHVWNVYQQLWNKHQTAFPHVIHMRVRAREEIEIIKVLPKERESWDYNLFPHANAHRITGTCKHSHRRGNILKTNSPFLQLVIQHLVQCSIKRVTAVAQERLWKKIAVTKVCFHTKRIEISPKD